MSRGRTRIDRETLLAITDPSQERNIYIHPNPVAREIFWQRIDQIDRLVRERAGCGEVMLDFGGGSGVVANALSDCLREIHIVDLDPGDAANIREQFGLRNVEIIRADVSSFSPPQKYDLAVAADVLEHFQDLAVPVHALRRLIRLDGLLVISVPTENWLYRLGRTIVRKTKPADHYHPAERIIAYLTSNGFALEHSCAIPKFVIRIPLFTVAVFRYKG